MRDRVRYFGPAHFRNGKESLVDRFGVGETPARRDAAIELADLMRNGTRLVLSEENFIGSMHTGKAKVEMPLYPLAQERLERLATLVLPTEIDVFVAIRNPAKYLTSLYCQILLGGRYPKIESFKARNNVYNIDWAEFIARLRSVKGIRRLVVWRYEDYAQVFPQITQEMLGDAAKHVTANPSVVHEGLSADAVVDIQIKHAAGERGTLVQDARAAYPKGADHPGFDLFLPEEHDRVAQQYTDQCAQIDAMQGVTLLKA